MAARGKPKREPRKKAKPKVKPEPPAVSLQQRTRSAARGGRGHR
jgi:hypothetical protein